MSDPTAPSSLPPEQPSGPSAPPPITPEPAAGTGLPPHIAASVACLLSIVGGIVFLVLEKKDQFVRFYAMQSTILGGAAIALSIALQIVTFILVHIPFVGGLMAVVFGLVGMVAGLAFFAFWIMTVYKSFNGKEWEIPYIGKIAREQLAKMTPVAPSAP